jgi:hypothetical protein
MSNSVFDYAPQLAGIEGTEPSVADLVRFYYKHHNCPAKYADEYLALLSIQQEADAKDAARYRWLRQWHSYNRWSDEEIDIEIAHDAAKVRATPTDSEKK